MRDPHGKTHHPWALFVFVVHMAALLEISFELIIDWRSEALRAMSSSLFLLVVFIEVVLMASSARRERHPLEDLLTLALGFFYLEFRVP